MSELISILRSHMGQQEAQEARRREEFTRQEQRFRALQHQFQLLQVEVQARTTPVPEPQMEVSEPQMEEPEQPEVESFEEEDPPCAGSSNEQIHPQSGQSRFYEPRLEKLTEEDDIEHFLTTFERMAVVCRWQKMDWVFHLIPLLTGKARGAYVHMDMDDSLDYDKVKAAILQKYDINPETYRLRFRSLEVKPDENPKELYARLKELYEKWVKPKGKTVHEVGETLILEQYLRMLSPELQIWIKERNPNSAAAAAELADVFVAARRKGQPWSHTAWKMRDVSKSVPHYQKTGVSKPPKSQSVNMPPRPPPKTVICYLCGMEGHTKPMCPKNSTKITQMCFVPRQSVEPKVEFENGFKMTLVEIDGKPLKALVDSGSTQTLVHRDFVPANKVNNVETIPVCCIHGDERSYPTADLYIKVQGQTYILNIGVAENLPFPVVLGRDLPVLFDLLNPSHTCNVAVTRAQAKKKEESLHPLRALPFYDADIETAPGKSRKSRRQRRQEKFLHTAVRAAPSTEPELPLGFKIPANIIEMQHDDPSLTSLFQKAAERNQETKQDLNSKGEFLLKDGILYRQQGSALQLVVPRAVQKVVLSLGHSIPWAGHLGKHKTMARIRKYFHWPGMRSDVTLFCKSCPQCQKSSLKIPSRAPLQSLPIISTPFERLGMDIVGPLERSKAGNRYMLVVTDYATKYPEVFPLRSIKAKAVALCLIQFFSRVGFPREILTDRGTNFMSTLLKQVYQLLGIKSLRTTPYHPQTDGLTERFNQTLKQMLRKFVNETGTDWDQWLPYLLFAYREVPQASTGFSPFELLYGHEVRGPLSLLRETWEGDQERSQAVNVVSYVVQMRERLEKMTELAQAHKAEAQQHQKAWYDQSARQRSFSPGQKVLVLLPSDDSKLLAKWQGPYEIQKKLGQTTYKVAIPDQPRSSRVLHINLLKEWVGRPKADVFLIREVSEEEEVDDQYLPKPTPQDLDLNHLPEERQAQVRNLCKLDVFSENPGRTDIVEHDIVLKDGASVKRMSYRIPERLLIPLKEEIDLMLSLGIIEASKSEWCHPVVLVPKKDGSIRFCIDFRAALLTDLTGARSPNKITWTEEAKMAFQDLRQSLSKSPVLHSPDFERNFILQTDASERGLGAVLLQGPPGERHPVAFISRKLFPREVRYSTIEKEGLAIKWALDSFRYYLLGREFILETDHKALQWIERMKDTNGRITRWYLAIQPFRFTINHIPGKDNCTADCLSRCPRERSEEGECVMAALTATQW
ncbi:uncharacterized protein si:ch211-282j22.3 isoform X2 [Pelmatolapia mariae]|uniref:uncharacterized protein si:ch211-282j22.3 isoform X2 n=1 Tax=Pelmatolapia mariae TaxID=158779 RepID=UPI002FE607D7